mgnify:CR=1 FL=1|jgi:hypothetical protein
MTTSVIFTHDAYESVHTIQSLTNEMIEFNEYYNNNLTNTILTRPKSSHGNLMIPFTLSDKQVLDMLQYMNNQDITYETLTTMFKLDFIWFDKKERQIMIWGENKEIVEYALTIIELWLGYMVFGYY